MRKLTNPWVSIPGYNCFGCAPHNENGVQMEFYEDGDEIVSVWHPKAQFQGWLNTLHGGIQSVLLDEICAWVVVRKLQTTGMTGKMETRFRNAVSTNDKYLTIRAKLVEIKHNIAIIEARLYNEQNKLCTEARCTYFTFAPDKAQEMYFRPCEPVGEDIDLPQAITLSAQKV